MSIMIMYIMGQDQDSNRRVIVLRFINVIFTITVWMVLLASSCNKEDENCHKRINIINNSDSDIYYYLSFRYPDTITLDPNPTSDPYTFRIEHNSEKESSLRRCFEGAINANPEGIIMYFIYDASTLETVPWDTVVKNYLILKRYDLSLEDLQGMDWTITYP